MREYLHSDLASAPRVATPHPVSDYDFSRYPEKKRKKKKIILTDIIYLNSPQIIYI